MIIVFVLNLFRIAKLGNGRCNRVAYIPVPAAWPLSAVSVRQEQKVAHEALWHV